MKLQQITRTCSKAYQTLTEIIHKVWSTLYSKRKQTATEFSYP